ncbi:MAG TPA: hypothetical protein VEL74_21690 [Thermoanaerobaculia bacterium]|nr:hypothetical protein [Thermoanaerobaculia bacterium]
MSEDRPEARGWITFCVLGLVVMATWTLVVKFLVPLLWYIAERSAGRFVGELPVMWDFWWVAHLVLAWLLWRRHRWAWAFGLLVAVIEIAIVITKFAFYLRQPDLGFWRLLWFTNKVYVLAFFVLFVALLARRDVRNALGAGHVPKEEGSA